MFKYRGGIYYVGDYMENEDDFREFKGRWRDRDKRDLTLSPIDPYEQELYETKIIKEEQHLGRKVTRRGIEDKYNFFGPGTHFISRYQGDETYKQTRSVNAPLIGRQPYDEPIDDLDWCACMHDLIYTDPLSLPRDITLSDQKLRDCWERVKHTTTIFLRSLVGMSSSSFSAKNYCEQRLGKEGTWSAAKQRDEDESRELNELESLRNEARQHLQSIIGQNRVKKQPITINLSEETLQGMQDRIISMGLEMNVPARDLFELYGSDIIAFSQLLRILFYVYDNEKDKLKERKNKADNSLKEGKELDMPLLSQYSSVVAVGTMKNKNKKRKKIKRRRTKRKMKTKKRNTKKIKKTL